MRVWRLTKTPGEELAFLIESGNTDAESLAGLSVIADLMALETYARVPCRSLRANTLAGEPLGSIRMDTDRVWKQYQACRECNADLYRQSDV
jgi:hypothetical protein